MQNGTSKHFEQHKAEEHLTLTGWCCKLQGAEADVIQSLVVEHHALIRVLNKLVHGESGVIGLHHSIRHFRRWEDRECEHHPVRVLLPDLRDEQGAHS